MFKTYGIGYKGGKVDDLELYADILTALGMIIPKGWVILTNVFADILESSQRFTSSDCPTPLLGINEGILKELEIGKPYAIRSSALSERGGTGIYHSDFFVPTGNHNRDLQLLWERECAVYASELSDDAKAWRQKTGASMGMAILIQVVPGYEFDGHWLPALAGVAYTSYQGLPTVRAVVGLGTQAVKGEGLIYNQSPDTEHPFSFAREFWDLPKADAIKLATGRITKISSKFEEIFSRINNQPIHDLFDKLAALKKQGDFSLEWLAVDDQLFAVQCAPHKDELPGDMTINTEKYFLLTEGSDVFNSGRKTCQGVVYVSDWSEAAAVRLKALNDKMTNYLLIITQDAFSELALQNRLSFQHFSNAGAVIEAQEQQHETKVIINLIMGRHLVDHSYGQGASHFQQLCSRSDILFVGSEFDVSILLNLPGQMDFTERAGVLFWDVEAIVLVDASKPEGFVYLAKKSQCSDYSPEQVGDYT